MEFITLVSSEANEISEKEAKKTIACDHITKALETLGFGEYIPAVMEAAAQHKETQKVIKNIVSSLVRSTQTNANARFAKREQTNSRTAACHWMSWSGYRQSSSHRRLPGITEM